MRKILYWTPRWLSLLYILFLMLFSLDVFSQQRGFWNIATNLFMHNIPALVLGLALIFTWRRHDWIAASVFLPSAVYYMIWTNWRLDWIIPIAGPAVLIGLLFLVNTILQIELFKKKLTST